MPSLQDFFYIFRTVVDSGGHPHHVCTVTAIHDTWLLQRHL